MTNTNRVTLFTFACLVLSVTSQQPELAAADCTGQVIPSPNSGTSNSALTSVAVVSASDMWSVGESFPTEDGYQALIEHWDGARWSVVPGPTLSSPHRLNAVAAAATDGVWTVGSLDPIGRTVIEHWDGTSWVIVPHPDQGIISPLLGVTVLSANDVWAVGYHIVESESGYQTLVEHWDGTSWSVVPSPNQPGSNTLHAVAASSANDIWAVGEYRGAGFNGVLIEHWNGASWSIMSVSAFDGSYAVLKAVSARTADDVWAVGSFFRSDYQHDQTVTLHWDATTWTIVPSPNADALGNELAAVTALANNDVWAVGSSGGPAHSRTLIEHWDGTSWSVVTSLNVGTSSNSLDGIVALAANDVWAVGTNGDSVTEHWDGTRWSVVASPNAGTAQNLLKGVATVSADDAWAVGFFYQPSNTRTLAQHWDGTSWSTVQTPNVLGDDQLTAVAAIATNDVWAVGYFYNEAHVAQTLTLHWDGDAWTIVPSPNVGGPDGLLAVAAVSTNDVWAVGGSGSNLPQYSNRSLILHWDGNGWNEIPTPDDAKSAPTGISVVSPNDIWAVGVAVGKSALILHWDGAAWSRIPGPSISADFYNLYAVTAISSNDVWAVGDSVVVYFDGEYYEYVYSTLTVHWDGTLWSVVASPNEPYSDSLVGVAAVNSTDIWAVGQYNGYEGFLEHWDGSHWTLVSAVEPPDNPQLRGVTAIPGGGAVWAVGAYAKPQVGWQTLIQRYGCQ